MDDPTMDMTTLAVRFAVRHGRVYAYADVRVQGVEQELRSAGTSVKCWTDEPVRASRDALTRSEIDDLLSILRFLKIKPPSDAIVRDAKREFNPQMDALVQHAGRARARGLAA